MPLISRESFKRGSAVYKPLSCPPHKPESVHSIHTGILRPMEVMNLEAVFDVDNNQINVTWTDSGNSQEDDLQYQITYFISARSVTLLSRNDTIANVNQTEYLIQENILPGVTVDVIVQVCNDFGLGIPASTSLTLPGGSYEQ